jgi:hypothetical protein
MDFMATRIDFREGYVVVHRDNKGGALFPVRLLESFEWQPR